MATISSEPDELWADVPGYEGLYQASNRGRIRSLPRQTTNGLRGGRILKPCLRGPAGHERHYVTLCSGTRATNWSTTVHQLVMLAFAGPCPEGQEVRHLDGNQYHNWLGNLKYGTHKENGDDMARHGFARAAAPRGSKRFRAKLTEDLVPQIRAEYAAGGVTQRTLASRYGVDVATIHLMLARKTWTHV